MCNWKIVWIVLGAATGAAGHHLKNPNYDAVVEQMGGLANAQSFFKLYLIPGGGHTSPHGTSNLDANPPAAGAGQFYKLMIDWVEKGVAPDRVEAKSPKEPVITQPFCPYPLKASYVGGNPRVTTSYACSAS